VAPANLALVTNPMAPVGPSGFAWPLLHNGTEQNRTAGISLSGDGLETALRRPVLKPSLPSAGRPAPWAGRGRQRTEPNGEVAIILVMFCCCVYYVLPVSAQERHHMSH
jgi:hypothetical protein